MHGGGNVVVLLMFTLSCWIRSNAEQAVVPYEPTNLALLLSFAGAGLALVTGWLGGELVDRLSVGVDEGANVDAPSSLSGRPATDGRRRATA
jgi:uncharacterized membrane protein